MSFKTSSGRQAQRGFTVRYLSYNKRNEKFAVPWVFFILRVHTRQENEYILVYKTTLALKTQEALSCIYYLAIEKRRSTSKNCLKAIRKMKKNIVNLACVICIAAIKFIKYTAS